MGAGSKVLSLSTIFDSASDILSTVPHSCGEFEMASEKQKELYFDKNV